MFYSRSKIILSARLWFAAAFLFAYWFETGAFWFYVNRSESPYFVYAAVLSHTFAALSFFITRPKPRALPGIGYYYPRLAALFTFFMPGIGLLGISMTLFMSRVFMTSHGLAEEYKEKAFEGSGIDVDLPEDINVFLYEELDIHPIADILAGDDVGMKRGAVNLLRRIGSAEAVSLLRKSLSDENAEVRFYAHIALARLEEDYAQSLDKAEIRTKKYGSAQSYAELGSVYRKYAQSGLPEINIQEQSMKSSCDNWKIASEMVPENTDYLMRLAEIYIESQRFSEAVEIYKSTRSNPKLELESRLGMCRAYFEMGNFIALFHEVETMRAKPELESSDPFKKVVYDFWMNGESAYE
ncbi:HEAT repeat domain-containing protein [Maridesulfovibrio ferrireducens]|uniref:HEAT repeat domain-containing protein n=1 Tax=Maridesulfovibrio ferrireducens TaxID=246191 RepID=UPI001A19F903|nr:HEAT repeat domain-containing protein [Maridesulfovibrio ferrireducens]MBI9111047.1 HEAT repeat domain-containing protein [Maridesulfovibrio ferrireducens]